MHLGTWYQLPWDLVTATLGPGTCYLGTCYLGKSVLGRRRVYCLHYLVNAVPTLVQAHTGSLDNAVDTVDDVTLTCADTSGESGTVTYNWYKGEDLQSGNAVTLALGKAKTASGSYKCEAVVADAGTSKKSVAVDVAYICEYHFYFIIFVLLLDVSFD